MTGEFTVWWWDASDGQHKELSFVDAQRAVEAAHRLCKGPAALLGMVKRVIITDGGDYTNFEWKHGEGITYPPGHK